MKREEAVEVYHGLINEKIKEAFEFFAPELAESEDERIRKELIDFVNHYRHNTDLTSEQAEWCKKVLTYLEKQKEQKSAEWSEEDEKMLKVVQDLIYGIELSAQTEFGYKQAVACLEWLNSLCPHPKAEWSEEDEEIREEVIGDLCALKDWIIKYDANWLANPALKNMGKRISWLKALPERFKLQPKQECSEMDKQWLSEVYFAIDHSMYTEDERRELKKYAESVVIGGKDIPRDKYLWFKSLRPSWKPSEEQMEALKYFVNHHQGLANQLTTKWDDFEELKSLYEDLKHLYINSKKWKR